MEGNGDYGTQGTQGSQDAQGTQGTRNKLLDDLRLVIRDAENLLRGKGQMTGDGYQAALERLESTLVHAKDSVIELEQQLMTTARETMDTADKYVHDKPWQSVGIGAAAGLAIGLWLGRR